MKIYKLIAIINIIIIVISLITKRILENDMKALNYDSYFGKLGFINGLSNLLLYILIPLNIIIFIIGVW